MKVLHYLVMAALLAFAQPVLAEAGAPDANPGEANPGDASPTGAGADDAPASPPEPAVAADAVAPAEPTPLPDGGEPAPEASGPAMAVAIPALTVVSVEIGAELGSKTSKTGDKFPIRLDEPIVVNGREIVPAGATGMGEVVHAKKSGGSGAAGELVLAARYLDVDGRRLRLRSMKLVPKGTSNVDTVHAINVASAATAWPIALIGFVITGGQAVVPQGTHAQAKTAEAFTVAAVPAQPATEPDTATEQPAIAAQADAVQAETADTTPSIPLEPASTQPAGAMPHQ